MKQRERLAIPWWTLHWNSLSFCLCSARTDLSSAKNVAEHRRGLPSMRLNIRHWTLVRWRVFNWGNISSRHWEKSFWCTKKGLEICENNTRDTNAWYSTCRYLNRTTHTYTRWELWEDGETSSCALSRHGPPSKHRVKDGSQYDIAPYTHTSKTCPETHLIHERITLWTRGGQLVVTSGDMSLSSIQLYRCLRHASGT